MGRSYALMYVLSAIIILNIIAILLLQNKIADEVPAPGQQRPAEPPAPVVRQERADVRAVVLPAQCSDCYDVMNYLALLNDTIDLQVERAQQRDAAAFQSPRLPAIAFNASIEEYPTLVAGWEQAGPIVEIAEGQYAGKWYVLPVQNAPFEENGTIHGRVNAVYLTMASCEECYGAEVLVQSMADVGIVPYTARTVDAESAEGKALIRRYNITAVPTLIMDGEARYYGLQPGWDIVGTIEEDGSYVLRDLQRMQVAYYDLPHKKLMKP